MTTFSEALAFTMYLGAANWDATPDQRVRLRAAVLPLLPQYKIDGDTGPVEGAVRAVMGPQWSPSGEWAAMLVSCGRGDLVADG